MRSPRTTNAIRLACLLPWVGLLAACGAETVPEADPPEPVIEAVAEVNGVAIARRQIAEVVGAEKARLIARGETPTEEALREMRREAMRLVVGGELCFQAAKAEGLEVSPDEIARQLEGARSQFTSEEDFRESLAKSGVSLEELEADAERRLLIASYVSSVTREVVLDTDEAKRIFDEQNEQFRGEDKIRVAHIIVRFLPGDSDEKKKAAREKIDAAWARLEAGEAFADVAREVSESPMARDGGDLGYFSRGRTLPEFEDKAFETAVGETTGVFETRHGYNIIHVLDLKEGRAPSFEEARTGLMMVLAREQRDDTLREHVQGLWESAEIVFLDPELEPTRRNE